MRASSGQSGSPTFASPSDDVQEPLQRSHDKHDTPRDNNQQAIDPVSTAPMNAQIMDPSRTTDPLNPSSADQTTAAPSFAAPVKLVSPKAESNSQGNATANNDIQLDTALLVTNGDPKFEA